MSLYSIKINLEDTDHGSPLTTIFQNEYSREKNAIIAVKACHTVNEVFSNYCTGPNFLGKTDDGREQVVQMFRAFSHFLTNIVSKIIQEPIDFTIVEVPDEYELFLLDHFTLSDSFELIHDVFDYFYESDISSGCEIAEYTEIKWVFITILKLSYDARQTRLAWS